MFAPLPGAALWPTQPRAVGLTNPAIAWLPSGLRYGSTPHIGTLFSERRGAAALEPQDVEVSYNRGPGNRRAYKTIAASDLRHPAVDAESHSAAPRQPRRWQQSCPLDQNRPVMPLRNGRAPCKAQSQERIPNLRKLIRQTGEVRALYFHQQVLKISPRASREAMHFLPDK